MALLPKVKLKAIVSFPATILDGVGVDAVRQNGSYQFNLAYDDFGPPIAGISDPAHQNALLWNDITQQYSLVPVTVIGSGGAVPEAPNDGVQYARQSLNWTPLVGAPGNSNPLMDGVAAPGGATAFSRQDHVHPIDTSRAPLNSPALTGSPTAPTAAIGTNTTQIATTAFVFANTSPALPAMATPLIESGTGVVGVSNKYAREDHVHPAASGSGSGDVVGPSGAIDSNFAAFNTTTGKLIKDSGNSASSFATPSSVSTAIAAASVRYDTLQALASAQKKQARSNAGVNDTNIVINGDFRVNQIGYVSGAALAANIYGHDQWKAGASGGDYSFTQLKSSTQITIDAGKSLIQPIEDANVEGGSYVLSWTGTAQARAGVNTLTPSGAYAASPLSISGQTAGTAMSVEFNSGTVGAVKLETGSVATPFVMRAYDRELRACQRYLYVYRPISATPNNITFGGAFSTTQTFAINKLAVPMRSTATLTVSSPTHFAATDVNGNGITLTALSLSNMGEPGQFTVISTVASGLVAGNASAFQSISVSAKLTMAAQL